ncbi:MAG: alanine racemase [Woeseiaceae bacterium]|nr:alanine racemase [Woeseiaceae bacterium]
MSFGARAVIRPDALRHNLSVIHKAVPGSRVMAVIKANAYGHGLCTVADSLTDADSFAVARLTEARELRQHGIEKPIVMLEGVWDRDDQTSAINQGCELVVHSLEQVELLEAHAGAKVTVWLKIDTGMHRLGFALKGVPEVLLRLRASPHVKQLRLMTHFSNADVVDDDKTTRQLERFASIAKGFDGDVSVANSPGALGWDEIRELKSTLGFAGDHWIRPGLSLYGVSPFPASSGDALDLLPAMQFEARLISVKRISAGESVGYRERFTADRDTTIGVIAAGYGDGYPRSFRDGTPVLLNGRRVPLAGIVSMDMLTVDLGPDARDRVGDVATLWGDGLAVEELAGWADTIPYTLLCGVMHRESA